MQNYKHTTSNTVCILLFLVIVILFPNKIFANDVISTVTVTAPISGGGGGGGGAPSMSLIKKTDFNVADINKDGYVDVYDLSLLMMDWSYLGTNESDLNIDKKVNEYDFSILMFNWGK